MLHRHLTDGRREPGTGNGRGRGLGEGLTRMVMHSLAGAGEARLHLWVTAGNTPAERIYERLGYARDPSRDWAPWNLVL